jgi:CubicO group peptidase (beta-lactamase class C family)
MQISRRHTLTLLCLGAAAAATAAPRRAQASPADDAASALDALAAQDSFSGAVLVTEHGRPLLRRAWGKADREASIANTVGTRFNIASMGKMFTAVAIGQLVEQGKLNWDDRLSAHVPDFPRAIGDRVTNDQLLTHRSGLGAYFASPRWAEAQFKVRTVADYVDLIRDQPLQFEPGARFGYSNDGYVMLGAVIERVTGEDYYAAMEKRIFRPAGMTRTGWVTPGEHPADTAIGYTTGCMMRRDCTSTGWTAAWPDKGSPAGGAVSTVDDMSAFVEALRGDRLVRATTRETLLTPRVDMPTDGPPVHYAYGFGIVDVNGKPAFGHNGGTIGFGAQLDALADDSRTFILLTNQDDAMLTGLPILRKV